jgi:cell division protein FtsB
MDALGTALHTDYQIIGTSIVQHVDVPADATYPITVDPSLATLGQCIADVGLSLVEVIPSFGGSTIVAGTLCAIAINNDNLAEANWQLEYDTNRGQILVYQSQNQKLTSDNQDLLKVINNPNSSTATKNSARSRIATNNATISANNYSISVLQQRNTFVKSQIDTLSGWY